METNFEKYFLDLEADFYHYMIIFGGIARKTSSDYVTRLKFLSTYYRIDSTLTEEYIDYILDQEDNRRAMRATYSSRKSLSDFRSCLRKFLMFLKSDYKEQCENRVFTEMKKITDTSELPATEKAAILQSRIGQGRFRKGLIDYWKGCSISNCIVTDILIASHIKPWRNSTNQERLDVYNGLLLLPNYDKLFDLGYMSFGQNGKAIYSKFLSKDNRLLLGLTDELSLAYLEDKHKLYLRYHNDNCFME